MRHLLCGAALAAVMGAPVAAQTQPGPADRVAQGGSTVSELIVTSRRREELVQEVPAAVTGLSAEQIQAAGGLRDIKDLSYLLPGLSFVDTGNINSENNIRGAGAGTARTNGVDSPIAVLRDGASITGGSGGGRTFMRTDLFDVARVEVTRGPQGALYGVNAVGGVIQAISQRPRGEMGGSLTAAYSPEIERYQLDGILNIPAPAANLGLRLGFQRADREKGFFYNAFAREYGDIEDYKALRLGVEWRPTDALNIFIVADQADERTAWNSIKSVNARNDPTLAATAVGPPDIDGPFIYQHNTSNDVNRNLQNLNAQVEWETPIGTFTAITLLRHRKLSVMSDADQSAPGYATPPFPAATCATRLCTTSFYDDTEIASQELRLAGDFGPALSWIVGTNYQGRQAELTTVVDGRTTSAVNLAPSASGNTGSVSKEEEEQFGLFTSVSWQLTDALTIDAAARYNRSDKKADAFSVVRQPSAALSCVDVYRDPIKVFAINPACVRARALIDDVFTNTAPSVAAKYEITPTWRLFASAGVGYRSGGFNANSPLDPNISPTYEPEKTVAFEVGTKFELAGGYFTLTAFRNNFDNLLVTVDSIGPDLVSRNSRFNAGEAHTWGVDFEVFGARRLGPDWGVINYSAAVNYLTGEIEAGPYAGRTVEGSPEWTYTLLLSYVRPLGVGDWRFVASTSYRGQRGGFTNTVRINNQVRAADLNLWNASVGIDDGSWRLIAEARNLFDKTYVSLADPANDRYADPREIRLTLSYAFGSEARPRARR